MGKIIEFLSGKKTSITAILSALLIFGIGRGWIVQDVAELIISVLVALGITLNVATAKYYAGRLGGDAKKSKK